MKKFNLIHLVLIAFALVTLISCGQDGEDGKAYVAINYEYPKPDTYWDDNDDVPQRFTWGYNYLTIGGKLVNFEYTYQYSDGSSKKWYGYYSISYPETGEPAGTFSDGADGADSFTTFYCVEDGENWLERRSAQLRPKNINFDVKEIPTNEKNKKHYIVTQTNKINGSKLVIDCYQEKIEAGSNSNLLIRNKLK